MNLLVVDDSRLAREELKRLLSTFDYINNVFEADSADAGINQLKNNQVDVILLDIDMPEKSGFDFLEELEDVPQVIFVTAFDEFATKAFEVNALDYITKPVQINRLAHALEKVKPIKSEDKTNSILTKGSRVFVKDGDKCWFVSIEQIYMIESEGNYSRIYFDSAKPLLNKSLNYLELRLDPELFFRANRSTLVNIEAIEHIEPWFSQSLKLKLKQGKEVETSRRQSQKFKELLGF